MDKGAGHWVHATVAQHEVALPAQWSAFISILSSNAILPQEKEGQTADSRHTQISSDSRIALAERFLSCNGMWHKLTDLTALLSEQCLVSTHRCLTK